MYKIEIQGESLADLKTNVLNFHKELNDEHEENEVVESSIVITETTPPIINVPVVPLSAPPVVTLANNLTVPIVNVETPVQGEVDARGFSWDARIHNDKKTKTKKGVWKNRRNTDKALIDQVEAQLKVAASIKDVASITATETAGLAHPVAPPLSLTPAPMTVVSEVLQAPISEPLLPAPVQELVTPVHSVETFVAGFGMLMMGLITSGKVKQDYVEALNGHFGVANIAEIDETQKAQLFEEFAKNGVIKKAV